MGPSAQQPPPAGPAPSCPAAGTGTEDPGPGNPRDGGLVAGLAAIAAGVDAADRGQAPGRAAGPAPGGVPHTLLAERGDGVVVRVGDVVAKAHAADADAGHLDARLAAAAHPRLRGILLPPHPVRRACGGRAVSVWPHGRPVDPAAPGAAPWEDAARLLARLHAVPPGDGAGDLPLMRGPAKAARAVAGLDALPGGPAVRTVRQAWSRLPAWARGEEPYTGPAALCHGDFHLGQLVRYPAPAGPWLLIDVDDLGAGDPAWDLARPAMWFAAGLLPPEVWARFLAAYRGASGTAVPRDGDPWHRLDVPARALAVQTAALALAKAVRERRELDGAESDVLATCARIARLQ